jgi:hypothetical protein
MTLPVGLAGNKSFMDDPISNWRASYVAFTALGISFGIDDADQQAG